MRVTDYVAEAIYQAGVSKVFLVTGGGMMFLSDGIAMHPQLNAVCTHHEQASAMAAVTYSKMTDNLGVAYLTTGCGVSNATTGLLNAWQDSIPVLFVSGQCKRKETIANSALPLRQLGVQEADIIPMVTAYSKYAVMVNEPQDIAYHVEKALYLAQNGRPGPTWLDIPLDVQGATIDEASLKHFDPAELDEPIHLAPSLADLEVIKNKLATAERPLIISGQGIRLARAIPEFQAFVKTHQIPVVTSFLGIDLLPSDEPLHIGRMGNKGNRAGNFAIQNADYILVLGNRLSVSATGHEYHLFGRDAEIHVVDIDPVEHQKNTVHIDHFIHADLKEFFAAFGAYPEQSTPQYWIDKCAHWKNIFALKIPAIDEQPDGIDLYYFMRRLSALMKDDAVVISDAGSALYACAQEIQIKGTQRFITSGAQAEMGYTLPATVGASTALNNGDVIGITGDGSFQMNIQELQTIVHNKLPIKLFIWNNNGYLSIRTTQQKFFEGRELGTDPSSGVSFPDLKKIADAYGIFFVKVETAEQLDAKIAESLNHDGPVLCEVMCNPGQVIIPSVASFKRPDGQMQSKPIEDMFPFLDRDLFLKEMINKPVDEA